MRVWSTTRSSCGGGHNGLTAAAYLARAGLDACVLERRDVLGGACVTEELWPGYHVSRAFYVVSMLQPKVVADLRLRDLERIFGLQGRLDLPGRAGPRPALGRCARPRRSRATPRRFRGCTWPARARTRAAA